MPAANGGHLDHGEGVMQEYLETAITAARAAGELQRERLWGQFNVEFKGEVNLVTEVDKQCEALIVTALRKAFPTHDILAEEGVYEQLHSPCKWIIDPLDGTTNFAHGF